MKYKLGKNLKIGDVIETWWRPGHDQITKLTHYHGPLKKTLGKNAKIAQFALYRVGMTIEPETAYKIV